MYNNMKLLSLLLTLLISTVNALADCTGTGIYFWPSSQTIKQNSRIVIEGYAGSQHVIHGLNKKYPIYLKSGDIKVKLTVKEITVGEVGITQAILIPEDKLVAGMDYRLFIDNLPEYEAPLQKWNKTTKSYEAIEWKVAEGTDTEKPEWINKPAVKEKTYKLFGCGPEEYVDFSFKVKDASEFLIKTTVTNTKTNKSTTYYLSPDIESFSIGHGMCSGAFNFREGDEFEATLDLIDASGNITTWSDAKVKFTKPSA
jgi:hypothetical protein